MKHIKDREEAELERERQKLDRQKKAPTRVKKPKIDRSSALDDDRLSAFSTEEPVSKVAGKKAIKKVFIAFLLCALCFVVVFLFANRDSLSFEAVSNWINFELLGKSNGGEFPVYINGTNLEAGNISLINGTYLNYVSDTAAVAVKPDGSEAYSRQISYAAPISETAGPYNLICNLDGTGCRLATAKEVVAEINAEGSIYAGAVNKSGKFALLTASDGYLSKLSVYNKDSKLEYAYSFSEYYAYSVDINESGTMAVVGAVSSSGGKASSAIYIIDFKSVEPVKVNIIDNSTIYSVKYLSENIACVICDNCSVVYDSAKDNAVKNDYNGRALTEFAVNKDIGAFTLVLSRSGDGRACDIERINSLGSIETAISTDMKITSVDMYKDKICTLSDGKINEYNTSGELLYTADAGNDAKVIKMYSDSKAYVIGISEIRCVDIAHPQEDTTAANTLEN